MSNLGNAQTLLTLLQFFCKDISSYVILSYADGIAYSCSLNSQSENVQATLAAYARRKFSAGEISSEHMRNIMKVNYHLRRVGWGGVPLNIECIFN